MGSGGQCVTGCGGESTGHGREGWKHPCYHNHVLAQHLVVVNRNLY